MSVQRLIVSTPAPLREIVLVVEERPTDGKLVAAENVSSEDSSRDVIPRDPPILGTKDGKLES
jgi:hypothetical protein